MVNYRGKRVIVAGKLTKLQNVRLKNGRTLLLFVGAERLTDEETASHRTRSLAAVRRRLVVEIAAQHELRQAKSLAVVRRHRSTAKRLVNLACSRLRKLMAS
jgi:hypothetical protein